MEDMISEEDERHSPGGGQEPERESLARLIGYESSPWSRGSDRGALFLLLSSPWASLLLWAVIGLLLRTHS